MPSAKVIYTELRQPLLRGGALLAGLLILALAAGAFNTRMDRARQSAQQQLQASVSEYRAALTAEQILLTDADRFAALRAQGFVGPEPRLRWVEDMRAAAAQAGLVAIRYELEPRRAHPGAQAGGAYQLFVSPMKLVLDLRHEGDLQRFMQLLESRHSGLFEVVGCALRRPRDSAEVSLEDANVSADCALRWYSLDVPDAVVDGGLQ